MSSSRKKTWYERQQQRKFSPFFRLVDRSFGFRLFLSGASAGLLLSVIDRFETCRAHHYVSNCLSIEVLSAISISNVEAFSIVTASLLYIMDRSQYREQKHFQCWEAISIANQAKAANSYGRIKALEILSEDGIWLDGFDLQGANLEYLEVPYGRLRGINLANANLMGADLRQADLTQANLANANLTNANLTGANLTDADLTNATLTGTNLTDADLTGTQLDLKSPERNPFKQDS